MSYDSLLDFIASILPTSPQSIQAELQRRVPSTDAGSPGAEVDEAARSLEMSREACASLAGFIRECWGLVVPNGVYVHGRHIDFICQHLEALSRGEFIKAGWDNRLMINVPPGMMKALDSTTPVLTTHGWKSHGDLRPGDFVFGPGGEPRRVLAVTEQRLEESYEVEFDDKATIVAGAGHLWAVERDVASVAPKYRRGRKRQIVTTPELRPSGYKHGKSEKRPDRIAVGAPINLAPQALLIEPYLLGCWLGDGSSRAGLIYAGEQDAAHFAKLGIVTKILPPGGTRKSAFHHIRIPGLIVGLRALGLVGNKHIPSFYLMGSIEQRLALLQGLMDTDGMCGTNGMCSFANSRWSLAEGVRLLAVSLGLKPYLTSRMSRLNGKLYGPHYHVIFTPPAGFQVFRVARKQRRVKGAANARSRYRYVEGVRPVGPRAVNCIQVEGSIYLAGRSLVPTHNSLLVMVFWPAWEWGPGGRPAMQYIASSYREDFCIRDSNRFRQLVQSGWFQERWPMHIVRSADKYVQNEFGGHRRILPFTKLLGGRADRVLIDDPHSLDGAESETQREDAIRQFRETGLLRLNDPATSAIVIIMQRLHQADLCGTIQALGLRYVHIMLPMRFDPERRCETFLGKDWRTEPGELIFKDRFPLAVLERDELGMTAYAVAGQFDQRPAPRGGHLFKRAMIKAVDVAPGGCKWVAGWDLAASEKKSAAYTCRVLLGFHPRERQYYVGHVVRERVANPEALILATSSQDLAMVGSNYEISIPQDPGAAGKILAKSLAAALSGYSVTTSPESSDKYSRAQPVGAQVEAGNLSVVDGPWLLPFLDELEMFPASARKDQVDALSRAFARFVTIGGVSLAVPIITFGPRSTIGDMPPED